MPSGKFIPFTKAQEQQIKDEFLLKPINALKRELGCSYGRIMRFLKINNLEIPKELIQKRKLEASYKKGSIPFNKGKKQTEFMSPEGILQAKKTMFQKGRKPHNIHPDGDGAIVLRKDVSGKFYKYIRIKKNVWKLYHREIWEKNHGEIPPNHIVVFKDKNTENESLENLELISMTENMYRNSFHSYPKEIIPSLILNKKLENMLNNLQNGTK